MTFDKRERMTFEERYAYDNRHNWWKEILCTLCVIGFVIMVHLLLYDPDRPRRNSAGFYEVNGQVLIPTEDDVRWLAEDPENRADAYDAKFGVRGLHQTDLEWARGEGWPVK